MKHFKLFLLPLLAMTLVFSSCEQQDLSLTYIEPIQDWGKSPQYILEKMTKSKSGATLEESDNEDEASFLLYNNYGIANMLVYTFEYNKLIYSYEQIFSLTNKQTIINYCDKKLTLVQIEKVEGYEYYLYHNKKKTSSILLMIDKDFSKDIIIFYAPYMDGDIEDFEDTIF